MPNIFFEIGAVIIIATLFAYIARLFKQPLIPAYIFAGLVIGPYLGLVTDKEVIMTTSEIGIALLLFIVGLEMDIKKLKHVSLVSSLGGTIQTLIVFLVGFIVAYKLEFFSTIESIYIGLIIAFSSTMVVIKLLSDKREIDTLHGRIVIGILLIQDIIAILALSVLTTIEELSLSFFMIALAKGIIVLFVAYIFRGAIFPTLFKYAAKSTEMLFMLSVTMCFFFAILFTYFGFSIAVGAFVAGVALAHLPYAIEIISKVKSLRDFFATIFFVSLGMELTLNGIMPMIKPLLIFFSLIIIFKPLVILVICSFFGYRERPSFTASISLAQISEFSLIIVTQGMLLGHISKNIFSLTVLLAISTIILTSYFINFDNEIYVRLKKFLKIFEKINKGRDLGYIPDKLKKDVVLCGYDRLGYSIYKKLKNLDQKILVVDFNPVIIKNLMNRGIPCVYGDVGDLEVIERLDLKNMNMLISTIPDKSDNLLLIKKIKEVNKKAIIIVTANIVDDALELYDAGADYVILPHFLGGEHASLLIEDFSKDIKKILKTKFAHIKELRERKSMGHEHPRKENHYKH